MIDLSNFNDLVMKSGRSGRHVTYVRLNADQCKAVISPEKADEVRRYFGNLISVKVNADLSIIVLMRGNDRRLGTNRDFSLTSLKSKFQSIYGENISYIYYDTSWDEDEKGHKVFVLRANGKKEYDADMTIRRVKDVR